MAGVKDPTLRLQPKRDRQIDVAATIRALRIRKGWRQTDLADAAGVAPNTVGGLEAGRRTLGPNVDKIARALGTTREAIERGDVPDPIAGLTADDLAIAHYVHAAPPAVRSFVRQLLVHASDLSARIAQLDVEDRAAIMVAIDAAEERRAAAATKAAARKA